MSRTREPAPLKKLSKSTWAADCALLERLRLSTREVLTLALGEAPREFSQGEPDLRCEEQLCEEIIVLLRNT